ncbi:MAG TPA: SusD/RagB family nutrient-binding outer membrane lipoprotein [Gemmatimonadales bacterium]|nr:SusD/RagB family nutrient-binding outer membrane lipoprotein [Gemmatimonadales bacterium]
MRDTSLSVLAAALVASATACGGLTDINTNPNGPTDVPPPSILANALQQVFNGVDGVTSLNIRGGGLWVQYYAEIQYRDEDKYIVRPGTSGEWPFYNGPLEDFQRMIDKGVAANTPNWAAVGRIMKSYTFSVMTDAMGDLPYSEALKGSALLTPKYDTQQAIYTDLFAQLTQASQEVAPTGIGFATGDIMYAGDMIKWQKFANSLRLRLALHLAKVDPTTAAAQAQAAVTAGVFQSNADNAQLLYLATSPNTNPIYTDVHLNQRDDYGMSKTYVDSLTRWKDPRLPVFAQLNKDTIVANRTYQGLPNGLNDGEGPNLFYISRFGAYWRETPAAPLGLLTYSEVLFLEAEAAQRGWIAGNAATLYAAAIQASMQQYGISDSATNAYLADTVRVRYNPTNGLTQIAYQKWVSLFMQGMESWTEVRRTGVPALVPGPRAVLTSIPERLPYDDQEQVLNKANVDAAVAAQGFASSTDLKKPLWFTGRQ